jgi:hypothetical protein
VTKARLDRRPEASGPPATGLHRPLLALERWTKETLWDCRMCGQCILHSTGLTCPMRCPKNLRNGPCGGTLQDGSCEVVPEMRCVWVEAWERSRTLPLWRDHITHVERPTDWRLQETSSWENLLSGRDRVVPGGWASAED